MIQVVLYSPWTGDHQFIRDILASFSLQQSVECELCAFQDVEQCRAKIREKQAFDLMIGDVKGLPAVSVLKEVRACHPDVLILPIADQTVVPSVYVCPEIMPYALLWRPLAEDANRQTLGRSLSDVWERRREPEESGIVIHTRQREMHIPCREVYYIEAREKRLFLRRRYEEIGFPGTLEQMEASTPPEFFRSHKSFLVNLAHLREIDWTTQTICLEEGIAVPFSRSRRKLLKESVHGIESGKYMASE